MKKKYPLTKVYSSYNLKMVCVISSAGIPDWRTGPYVTCLIKYGENLEF